MPIAVKKLPVVGIPTDVIRNGLHPAHAVGEKYINALAHGAGVMPVLLPAFGEGEDLKPLEQLYSVDDLLDQLDGLFLTGSPSNIQPHHYGQQLPPGTHHEDPQRDATTLPLISRAYERKVPLLAICRGFQEINVALGGTLHQRIHEVPGFNDHREDKMLDRAGQYGPSHLITPSADGHLAQWLGSAEPFMVNSLHGQGVDKLAPLLQQEAVAEDGIIEAYSAIGEGRFLFAAQWHPEWQFAANPQSVEIFAAFGQAIRRNL